MCVDVSEDHNMAVTMGGDVSIICGRASRAVTAARQESATYTARHNADNNNQHYPHTVQYI